MLSYRIHDILNWDIRKECKAVPFGIFGRFYRGFLSGSTPNPYSGFGVGVGVEYFDPAAEYEKT